jgi:uncharacterized protein DUF4232
MRAALLVGLLALVAGTANAAPKADTPCKASQLTGSFNVVMGSAGAGNIVYALRLENVSYQTCTLTGLPQVRLLDRHHNALPTQVVPAMRGALTAVLVRVRPNRWASASARFSPDVPGPGEPAAGKQCERTAFFLRVTAPGGGKLTVKIKPATPVCEHGGMQFSVYQAGTHPQPS